MIQATELRIGNNLLVNGKIIEVEGIHEQGLNPYVGRGDADLEYDFEFNKIDPIPLTNEILEKCGFETYQYVGTGDFNVGGSKLIKANGYDYKIIATATDWNKWNLNYETNPFNKSFKKEVKVNLKEFEFFHQLQNLFFALTGEELKIEL